MTPRNIVLGLALAAVSACAPKTDTAPPDGDAACTEEAKECPDGTSVSREGPQCEFPACPGEGEELEEADDEAPEGDEADADADAEATPASE